MTDAEIRAVVHATLIELGIDMSQPIQAQRDFAWLRKSRRGSEEVAKWGRRTIYSAFFSGLVYALWLGLKAAFKGGDVL